MTAPRIIPAAEAAALLEGATPGPWLSLPLTVDPIGPDLIVRVRMRDGDSDLVSAAPDLAASVVALHAEVERARRFERARIVAWLKERSDTAYAAGNEPRGDALLNASRVLQGGPVTAPRIISAAVAREAAQPKPWRSPIVQRAHDEADHDYAETTLDRDDRPIRPTCAYCGRSTPYCKGRKP